MKCKNRGRLRKMEQEDARNKFNLREHGYAKVKENENGHSSSYHLFKEQYLLGWQPILERFKESIGIREGIKNCIDKIHTY